MTTAYANFIAAEIALLTPVASTPEEATGYGSDLVCVADIDPAMRETDPESTDGLAQDNFHRITTPREGLPDDLDYGIDVAEFLSSPDDYATLLMQAGIVRLELLKDDRNSAVEVTVSGTTTRVISITVTPEDPSLQTFTMIVTVTQAGATLETV